MFNRSIRSVSNLARQSRSMVSFSNGSSCGPRSHRKQAGDEGASLSGDCAYQ